MYQLREETGSWASALRPTDLPDTHLVQMAQRDPAAFVHLYERYVASVYRYCALRLSPTAAEDATSVTFLNALKAISRFDIHRSGFRTLAFRDRAQRGGGSTSGSSPRTD